MRWIAIPSYVWLQKMAVNSTDNTETAFYCQDGQEPRSGCTFPFYIGCVYSSVENEGRSNERSTKQSNKKEKKEKQDHSDRQSMQIS